MAERLPWKRASDPAVEAQLDRFDIVMDMVLQRWRAAEIAKVDLAWEKIVPLLPDDRAWEWLDNLQRCIANGKPGTSWSPAFPTTEKKSDWPTIDPGMTFSVKSDEKWHIPLSAQAITPTQERRAARFAMVQRLKRAGFDQVAIATQVGVSQATVSKWLRRGI